MKWKKPNKSNIYLLKDKVFLKSVEELECFPEGVLAQM